ncbi:hypothetical protein C8R45DRAFT_924158 [Mycena sanguinolenta]|nr:hypothetical protein C8R45DRAFT_924158 [Mycena sanguinolenta]
MYKSRAQVGDVALIESCRAVAFAAGFQSHSTQLGKRKQGSRRTGEVGVVPESQRVECDAIVETSRSKQSAEFQRDEIADKSPPMLSETSAGDNQGATKQATQKSNLKTRPRALIVGSWMTLRAGADAPDYCLQRDCSALLAAVAIVSPSNLVFRDLDETRRRVVLLLAWTGRQLGFDDSNTGGKERDRGLTLGVWCRLLALRSDELKCIQDLDDEGRTEYSALGRPGTPPPSAIRSLASKSVARARFSCMLNARPKANHRHRRRQPLAAHLLRLRVKHPGARNGCVRMYPTTTDASETLRNFPETFHDSGDRQRQHVGRGIRTVFSIGQVEIQPTRTGMR